MKKEDGRQKAIEKLGYKFIGINPSKYDFHIYVEISEI